MANCCESGSLEIRLRSIGSGSHYVYQCTSCGKQKGSALRKDLALEVLGGKKPKKFDNSLFQKGNGVNRAVTDSATPQTSDRACLLSRFQNEDQIKEWVEENMSEDFHIQKEVPGIHISTGQKIIIDYLFYPRYHLICEGFEQDYFGVEVKFFHPEGLHSKMGRGLWQAMTYQHSNFDLEIYEIPGPVMFTTVLSNLSFGNIFSEGLPAEFRIAWQAMLRLANHAKVGNFVIAFNKIECCGWILKFAGANYFRKLRADNDWVYKKGNHADKIINKLRIGNYGTIR